MPWPAWKRVLGRAWTESGNDNLGLIAGGIAFSAFLAIVPILAATVLGYGIFADRQTVIHDVNAMAAFMPREAAKLVGEQLLTITGTSDGKKGFALILALGLALFSARSGAGAVITALNIAYEEKETRSLVRFNLLAIAITAGGVAVAILAMIAATLLGQLEHLLPTLPDWALGFWKLVSYALMTTAGAAGAATLYRFGPARRQAKWVWLTPGSVFTAALWLLLTIGFGIYVANFGDYGATYGALSSVVVLLTWLYLSAYILLFGAELNAEFEHETAEDTTIGHGRPLGERRAWMADHVAPSPPPPPEALKAIAPPEDAAGGRPGPLKEFEAVRIGGRVLRRTGLEKVGLAPALLATAGLSLLRREGRGLAGAAALAAAGGLAFAARRPAPLKAVLFDLDGTLVDSNGFHVRAWDQAFREHGYELAEAAIAKQIGKGGDLLVPALLPDMGELEAKQIADRQGAVFKERYLDEVQPFPGARKLLRRVRRSGRTVVLASSAGQEEIEHYLDLLEARTVVAATTSIDDVETSKPAGDIFAAALAKAGVWPGQALVIGDTPYDIAAATKVGVRAVAVRSGGFADDELRGAVAMFDDVAAVLRGWKRSPFA
jgi:HAD superfamily hydrolase (TIGR01509 family)